MSYTTYYQLLDRELPGVIVEASNFLNSAANSESNKSQDIASLSATNHRNWDPLSGERTEMGSFSAHLIKLQDLREQLGRLSLAYAISQHRPFAESAQELIRDQITQTHLFSIENASIGFEDVRTKAASRICMVEIVLSFELLHNLGALKGNLLHELNSALRNYLVNYDSIKFSETTTRDRFAWALESLVIAMFLNQKLVVSKIKSQVEEILIPELDQLFIKIESADLPEKGCEEFIFATECFFGIDHWARSWSSSLSLGEEYYLRFEKLLSDGVFKGQLHGAWDSNLSKSVSPHLLSCSSLFLLFGKKLNRPEIVSLWIQQSEKPHGSNSHANLITNPLLWFPFEEWNYEPFVRNSQGEMASLLRY